MNKSMKTLLTLMAALLLAEGGARAAVCNVEFTENTVVPDGNPVGLAIDGIVSGHPSGMTVGGLTVSLNISGGYNGSLYAYLVSPNKKLVTLMNQPGVSSGNSFGASGAGMNNITLQDGASQHGSIQNETSKEVLFGSYNAMGSLSAFNGSAVDGTWTLFFADMASGGGESKLVDWSLNITAVPEPDNAGVFAVLALVVIEMGRVWWRHRVSAAEYPISNKEYPMMK